MTNTIFMGEVLSSLREIADLIFRYKVPDFGYLFTTTTILLFLFDFKNVFKIKSLNRQLKIAKETLHENSVKKETS